jgi:hypothetical protein
MQSCIEGVKHLSLARSLIKKVNGKHKYSLHYVDQNGPHAEWKYDKRESLGLSKTTVCDQTNQEQSI